MLDMKTTMELLTGRFLTNTLIDFWEQNFADFPEVRLKYQEVIARLEKGEQLGVAIDT